MLSKAEKIEVDDLYAEAAKKRADKMEEERLAEAARMGAIILDNGRLRAENEQLLAEKAKFEKLLAYPLSDIKILIERLEAEKAEAIELARFYGDKRTWCDDDLLTKKELDPTYAWVDQGQKARDLLKKWGMEL